MKDACWASRSSRAVPLGAGLVFTLALVWALASALMGCRTGEVAGEIGDSFFSKGGIAVRTQPSGAMVYINEKRVGRAPLVEPLRPGLHRLVVKKRDFETQELWVEVPKGKTAEVLVRLERL